jgi:thiol:disulfide interchange protein
LISYRENKMKHIAYPVVFSFLISVILQLLPFPAHAFLGGDTPSPVRAELFSAGQEDGTLVVGLHLTMDDGWHVYWQNPGEAGMPVKINWELPEGYHAGPLAFPAPESFDGGGMTGYGYEGEVVLFSTIHHEAGPGTDGFGEDLFPLRASVEWLACSDLCIPGSAELVLVSSRPDQERLPLVSHWRSRLPLQAPGDILAADGAVLEQQGNAFVIRLGFSGTEAGNIRAYYPLTPAGGIDFDGIRTGQGGVVIPLRGTEAPESLSGVVVTSEKAYHVEFPEVTVSPAGLSGNPQAAGTWGALFSMLGLAFAGGMLLNVMPCVLPVLGLKVFSLIGPAGADTAHRHTSGRMLSLVFAGGVIFSFWVLAASVLVLKGMGEQIGWGFQFQSPAFIMFIAAVVFAFGLNLFGVFEFSAPVVSGKLGKAASHHDSFGAFVSGVLATTLATPCTAPFLGTALGFAFSQPPLLILLFFTVIAIGMSAPYVILAWHPAWLKFLPRPGEWMYRFKQVMGFILMAVVVWLASLLGTHGGAAAMVNLFLLLFIVAFIFWVIGLQTGPGTPTGKQFLVWIVSLAVTAGAYAQLMPESSPVSSPGNASSGTYIDTNGVEWKEFSPSLLEALSRERKTVFIDFTADWCLTCKVMEASVLSHQNIARLFEHPSIIPVRADWTSRNDDITSLLQKFGRSGVPLFVILPQGDVDRAVILPEVITVDMLENELNNVLQSQEL